MRKEDLSNGAIVIIRAGYAGVVIKDADGNGYILYPEIGADDLMDFNDNLSYDDEDYRDGDIMEVYGSKYEYCTFLDVEDGEVPTWERDPNWKRPTKEERRKKEEQLEQMRQKEIEKMRQKFEEERESCITIMTQAFYGNRTITRIRPENVDNFILGYMGEFEAKDEEIDRTIIMIPHNDNLALIYNRIREEKRLSDGEKWFKENGYIMKPLAEIPEENVKIFSRCIACRIDPKTGELESLQEEDYDVVMRYLAV